MAKKKQQQPEGASGPGAQTKKARAKVRSIVERVERLKEEQSAIGKDIADILADAKAEGYNIAAIKEVIRRRAMDPEKREEFLSSLDIYEHAVQLPLFDNEGAQTETRREAADLAEERLPKSVAEAAQALQDTVNETGAAMTIEVPGMDPVTIAPQT